MHLLKYTQKHVQLNMQIWTKDSHGLLTWSSALVVMTSYISVQISIMCVEVSSKNDLNIEGKAWEESWLN